MVNANQRKLTHVYLRDHTYLLCLGSNIVRFPGLNFLYTKSDPLVPLLDDSTTPQPPLRELFVPHIYPSHTVFSYSLTKIRSFWPWWTPIFSVGRIRIVAADLTARAANLQQQLCHSHLSTHRLRPASRIRRHFTHKPRQNLLLQKEDIRTRFKSHRTSEYCPTSLRR